MYTFMLPAYTFKDVILLLAVEIYIIHVHVSCMFFSSTIYDTHARAGQNKLKPEAGRRILNSKRNAYFAYLV